MQSSCGKRERGKLRVVGDIILCSSVAVLMLLGLWGCSGLLYVRALVPWLPYDAIAALPSHGPGNFWILGIYPVFLSLSPLSPFLTPFHPTTCSLLLDCRLVPPRSTDNSSSKKRRDQPFHLPQRARHVILP